MKSLISKIFNQYILAYTLYDTVCSSQDFHDVKLALNDRTEWSIEPFRSCFTYFLMLSMTFLVIAETIQVHYGRLSPVELKECAESMGYATFAILFAVLDIGFVVVRVAGFVALSEGLGLGTNLVLVNILPLFVLPLLTYAGKLAKWRRRTLDREGAQV